ERAMHSRGWKQAPVHPYQPGQHQTQPEGWRGETDQREHREPAVLRAPSSEGLSAAEPQANGEVDQQDRPAEQETGREPLGEKLRDRSSILDRRAEVSPQQSLQEGA